MAIKLEVLKYKTDATGEICAMTLKDETGQIREIPGDIVAEKYYQRQITFVNFKVKKGPLGNLVIVEKIKKKESKVENKQKKIKKLQQELKKLEEEYSKGSDDFRNYYKEKINDTKDKIIRTKREIIEIHNENLSDSNIYTTINYKNGLARQRKAKNYKGS